METQQRFETSTVYTPERYRKFGEFHLRSTVKWSRILLWLCAALLAVFTTAMLLRGGLRSGYAVLCYLLAAIFVPLPWLVQWITKRQIEASSREAAGTTDHCVFYDDHFVESNGELQTTAFYPRIWRAVETDDCFYLYLDRSSAAVVEKTGFLMGDAATFRLFLQEKLGDRFRLDGSDAGETSSDD